MYEKMIAFRECWYSGQCKIKQLAVEVKAAPTLGTPSCNQAGESFSVFLLRKLRRPHACYVCLSRVCVTLRYIIYLLNS